MGYSTILLVLLIKLYLRYETDTAGQEEYESLRQLSYQDADVVLVCFSLVSRYAFLRTEFKGADLLVYIQDQL